MTSSPDPIVVTVRAYEAHAGEYANYRRDRSAVQPQIERFAGLVGPGARILDLGCGPGVDTASLAKAGLQPIALDVASSMTRLAQAEVPGVVTQGDSRELPFASGSFDGVWANASLLHLPKSQVAEAVLEVRRVLRAGGMFFAGMQRGKDDGIEVGGPRSSMQVERFYARYEPEEWSGVLREGGFDVVEAEAAEFWLRTYARKP
jgi:ubiquinone/menaquinone biosynthesis C-methylase UbiE